MPEKRVIVALDVGTLKEAGSLVESLAPHVACFKVGIELLSAVGLPTAVQFVRQRGGRVFADTKLKDIPNTVAGASREIMRQEVWMFNMHCDGGSEMMRAAKAVVDTAKSGAPTIDTLTEFVPPVIPALMIGVTLLTSLSYNDLVEMRLAPEPPTDFEPEKAEAFKVGWIRAYVRHYAVLAKECGLDGVVASPHEITVIREACGPDFLIVTPSVRPTWAAANDQKRIMTPGEAARLGSNFLVIGRPITKPPAEIGSPLAAITLINAEINEALTLGREMT